MKRKKDLNCPFDEKPLSTVSRESRLLLSQVSKLKSQVKVEKLRSSELDLVPVKLNRLKGTSDLQKKSHNSDFKEKQLPKETLSHTKRFYKAKPSETIAPTVFRKAKSEQPAYRFASRNNPIYNIELDDDDEIHPIGKPIIRNLADQKIYDNVGYSSLLHHDERETHLSGHILSGVNIIPNDYKDQNQFTLLKNHKAINHFEEVIDSQQRNPIKSSEQNHCSAAEKFSWDKLSDSISLVVSETNTQKNKQTFKCLKQKDDVLSNEDTLNTQPNSEPCISKTRSDNSLNDGYSLNFEEIEVNDSSENAKDVEINEKGQTVDVGAECNMLNVVAAKSEDQNEDILVLDEKTLGHDAEELSHADNIVHQIYNKLHLSLDSACSTISDRLSTIPEDPRSHEEHVQHVALENVLSHKSSLLKPIIHSDETNYSIKKTEISEYKKEEINDTVEVSEINQLNDIPDSEVHREDSLKSTEENDNLSLSEGPLSDRSLNKSFKENYPDVTSTALPMIEEILGHTNIQESHISLNDQSRNDLVKSPSSSSYQGKDVHQEVASKPTKSVSYSKSTSSSLTSFSSQISIDSSSDNKVSIYYSSNEDSKKCQTSKLSEISNISEGQLLNYVLSEGELSQSLKSNEEISKANVSIEYLADESANCSDVNRFSVPKQASYDAHASKLSSHRVSNKRRQELKTNQIQSEQSSSSSCDASNTNDMSKGVNTWKESPHKEKNTISEGELSANSEALS